METLVINDALEWAATLFGGVILLILPFELWHLYRTGAKARRWLELLASAAPVIPTLLTAGVVGSYILGLYLGSAQLALFAIPTTPLTIALTIIAVDFLYYWDHRCAHENRSYWAIAHSVHHSSPHYDQSTALRVSFVDGFISPLFYLPVVLIGVEPMLVLGAFGLIIAYQQWLHTERIGRLPLLDSWLNTPSNHRVHHAMQAQYLDKNYGAILMLWDRLFGTYMPETTAPEYGLTEALDTVNPWHVHTHEACKLAQDVFAAKRWRDAIGYLWHKPGWRALE